MADDDVQLKTPQPRAGTLREMVHWSARLLSDVRDALSRTSKRLNDLEQRVQKIEEQK